MTAGGYVLDGPVLPRTLGVGIGTSVGLLGRGCGSANTIIPCRLIRTDSLAVKAGGMLKSFLYTLGAGRSRVPWLVLVPSTSALVSSSSSASGSSRSSSRNRSLGCGSSGGFGLSGSLGGRSRCRRLSVV